MVKNIKYDADTKDLASLMNEEKAKNYSQIAWGVFIILIALIQLLPLFSNDVFVNEKIVSYTEKIISIDISIDNNISVVNTYYKYHDFLSAFGTSGECTFFLLVSLFVFKLFISVYEAFPSSDVLIPLFVIFSISIMQLVFVILASWKVWLIAVIYAFIKSIKKVKPYKARDILGIAGNGRMFFSGVRAGIKKCDKNGNPTLHITGLTCLSQVNEKIYKKSAFCTLLEKYGAENETNKYLASIILHYYNYPTFINDGIGSGNLFEDTYEFLINAFEIQQEIISENDIDTKNDKRKENMVLCLTKNMKKELKNIVPKNIATAIMALETGRILAYEHISNDRWTMQSNYPHLCARAILHSSPYYGDEYDFDEREMIRKALVFAERKSDFLEIRMPLKMNTQSYTLRQWLELILHFNNADSIIDELQFFAKSTEIHKAWTRLFVQYIENSDDLQGNFFVTEGGQLFAKLEVIYSLLSDSIKNDLFELSDLIKRVYNKREADNLVSQIEQKKLSDDNNSFLKEFSQNTKDEISKYLPKLDDVIIWQNLRSCLNAFSWLGKRVSDRYVPYSAVIDCKFLTEENEIKDVSGLVLFRTSKLVDYLGERWSESIEKVKMVKITKATAMKLEEGDK